VRQIAECSSLEHLNISFAHSVTSEALKAFEGKTLPISHLNFSGMTGVDGKELFHPIFACKDTLKLYNGSLMD